MKKVFGFILSFFIIFSFFTPLSFAYPPSNSTISYSLNSEWKSPVYRIKVPINKSQHVSPSYTHPLYYEVSELNNKQIQLQDIQIQNSGYIEVSFQLMPQAGTGEVLLFWRVEEIVGDEPDIMYLTYALYGSVLRDYPKTFNLINQKVSSPIFNPSVGDTGTVSITISKTYYYVYSVIGELYEDGFYVGGFETGLLGPDVLLNKKAVVYPYHFDPYAFKLMVEPERTDWAQTPSIPWTSYDRQKYIQWYDMTYPHHRWNWNEMQIHHIRPRNYGGTNDYDNLIPIKTTDHYTVNAWWANY